jgi:hypothetical protein
MEYVAAIQILGYSEIWYSMRRPDFPGISPF